MFRGRMPHEAFRLIEVLKPQMRPHLERAHGKTGFSRTAQQGLHGGALRKAEIDDRHLHTREQVARCGSREGRMPEQLLTGFVEPNAMAFEIVAQFGGALSAGLDEP